MYPEARITSKRALRVHHKGAFRSVSIDFLVAIPSGNIVVETKAPYTDAVADVVNSALRRLKTVVELLSTAGRMKTIILAIPTAFPEASLGVFEETQLAANAAGATIKVWDANELLKLVSKYLSTEITSFSIEELKKVLGVKSPAESVVAPGLKQSVVVLVADFCSFTSFVHASIADAELIESVMARFYRETRQAINEDDGVVDKYMGDGVLAYWFGEDAGARFEKCLQRLMGIAVNLADEWQDQIDSAVEPKGLRAGGAIGDVLFVSENPPNPPIHAIGDSINVASRLQGIAKPNSLVITNRLRKRFFGTRDDFEWVGKVKLKNIDPVIAWRKNFGNSST